MKSVKNNFIFSRLYTLCQKEIIAIIVKNVEIVTIARIVLGARYATLAKILISVKVV